MDCGSDRRIATLSGMVAWTIVVTFSSRASAMTIASPGGNIVATITIDAGGRLQYGLARSGKTVLDTSALGITVDGVDLGTGVTSISASDSVEVNTTYPCRGVKTIAVNHYNEITIDIARTGAGDPAFMMIWRVYDDGAAFRYVIPGSGLRTISDGEASSWVLPPASTIWYQINTASYEGVTLSSTVPGLWSVIATPLTCKLPATGGYAGGYAVILEAALFNYSGLHLEPVNGTRTFRARQTFNQTWQVAGGSCSPWRATLTADTLNDLVNSTLVANLSPEPSPELADASWIRPGRSVWSWWSDYASPRDFNKQKQYVDYAQQLGFEYSLVDDKWETWTNRWDLLRQLCEYAAARNVQIWVWKRYSEILAPADRQTFFQNVRDAGAVGVKIDFMNSESQAMMQFYESALADAAAHHLMVNFHGATKPTGMDRTYPNEMTREGVRGLEYNSWGEYLQPSHNAALPFTRLVAGHADYTPVTFWSSKLGSTSFAHQLAMAVLLTSPVTHFADDPTRYLTSPALDVIRAVRTTWDETAVLDASAIGELAAFARRRADRWFLALVNGNAATAKNLTMSASFLDAGYTYSAVLLADSSSTPAAFNRSTSTVRSADTLNIWLRAGGGFVGMFTPEATVPPMIDRSPASLTSSVPQGEIPPSRSFTITNTGGGTLTYTIQEGVSWLRVEPTSGTATTETDTINVRYATADLTPGTYIGTITISDANAGNNPQTVTVTLTVSPFIASGDFDRDGDVDLGDFALLQMCFNGPNRPPALPCECPDADLDDDKDVDLADFGTFQSCFNGPNRLPLCR